MHNFIVDLLKLLGPAFAHQLSHSAGIMLFGIIFVFRHYVEMREKHLLEVVHGETLLVVSEEIISFEILLKLLPVIGNSLLNHNTIQHGLLRHIPQTSEVECMESFLSHSVHRLELLPEGVSDGSDKLLLFDTKIKRL